VLRFRLADVDWFKRLSASIEQQLILKLYYGHFFCHVFPQDYIVCKGHDCQAVEHAMYALPDERGA
jgi:D-lactate dehydrogenase